MMKKIIILFFTCFYIMHSYAQDTIKTHKNNLLVKEIKQKFDQSNIIPATIQEATEIEISRALIFNMEEGQLKDSVALYTFAISIKGIKKNNSFTILEIKSNDKICYKLYPRLDSILKNVDFGVFIKKNGLSHLVIPVAVVLTTHDKMPKNSSINVWDISKRLNILFDSINSFKYESIYLSPKTIMVDNQIYQ